MSEEPYTLTTSEVARAAEVLPETVRAYGDLGLISFVRLGNGMRLHRPSVVQQVRVLYKTRMRNRGRYQRRAASA